jgi:hypothetical protein
MATEDPDRPPMRASDADREAVVEQLRVALNEGRLTITEFDERVRDAYAAITLADLAPLTADLPEPVPARRLPEVRRESDRRKLFKEWRDWAGTSCVLVLIWAVTSVLSGGLNPFWPIIPMGIWALIIIAGVVFGDSSDDDGHSGGSKTAEGS